MTEKIATIIIPTLEFNETSIVLAQAEACAGIKCAAVLVKDYARRGSTICGNAAFKAGLELKTPYICYMNDDTWITQQDWLKHMIEVLDLDSTFGVAVPSGGCRTRPQSTGYAGMPEGYEIVKEAAFICAVFKRQVLDTVGVFDYRFVHYGNDSDLLRRIQFDGWHCVWVHDVYVSHKTRLIDEKWQAVDKAAFNKKWK